MSLLNVEGFFSFFFSFLFFFLEIGKRKVTINICGYSSWHSAGVQKNKGHGLLDQIHTS